MELKHLHNEAQKPSHRVLIVPYGIETIYNIFICICYCVLIVPYGIETAYSLSFRYTVFLC